MCVGGIDIIVCWGGGIDIISVCVGMKGMGAGKAPRKSLWPTDFADRLSLSALATPPYTHLANGFGRRGMVEEPADGECWRGSGCYA